MKALISPNDPTPSYVSGWTTKTIEGVLCDVPICTEISNAYRVAQVEETEFEVANPLFWVDCNNSVVADLWYYDFSDNTIKEIEPLNVPRPE